MIAPPIKVEGLKKYADHFKLIESTVLQKMLRDANKSAAEIVAEAARKRTPVKTGAARRSVRASAGQKSASVRGGGPKAPYFGFLDYGNKVHAGGGVGRGDSQIRRFVAGGRIVYPALAAERDRVTEEYAKKFDEVIGAYHRRFSD